MIAIGIYSAAVTLALAGLNVCCCFTSDPPSRRMIEMTFVGAAVSAFLICGGR